MDSKIIQFGSGNPFITGLVHELKELVYSDKYRPHLTYAEILGLLEIVKWELMYEAQ